MPPLDVAKVGRVDGAGDIEVPDPREELIDVRAEVRGEVVKQDDASLASDRREAGSMPGRPRFGW